MEARSHLVNVLTDGAPCPRVWQVMSAEAHAQVDRFRQSLGIQSSRLRAGDVQADPFPFLLCYVVGYSAMAGGDLIGWQAKDR